MRSLRKQKPHKINHRYISQRHIKVASSAARECTLSPSEKLKSKLKKRKRTKILKRLTKLAKKLRYDCNEAKEPNNSSTFDMVGIPSSHDVPVQKPLHKPQMEELWQKACQHYTVPEDVTKSWYTRIKQRLSESPSKRYYHNWNEMMQHKYEHLQHCKPSLILAAFFQYYTYDGVQPCAKENCAAFEEFCCAAALDDQESKNLILRLLGDESAGNELHISFEDDANLLQDMDLVILAANSVDYKRYCQLLRQEYEHMSDGDYKNMRLKVLQTLLSIPNIYSTPEFQKRYEAAARTNIKDEINALKA